MAKKNGKANGKKNGAWNAAAEAERVKRLEDDLQDEPPPPLSEELAWLDSVAGTGKKKAKGPKQRELPTMERQRIEELDADIDDRTRNEEIMERAKQAIAVCEARIQLGLVERKLEHYDFVDGPITIRVRRTRGKEKLVFETISTEVKAKKERGGDRKKAKKPEPVMPAPQVSP